MRIEEIATRTHEKVLYGTDPASGLRSFIALHDTTLGPGLGGCRMWNFASPEDALTDVLRLSEGMTAKSALAGVPFGGGKVVIIGNARTDKTPDLLRAFGRFVETLKGGFITGEDVGMTPRDMAIAATETDHISGLDSGPFASGDPAPVTADGVFRCMQVAAGQRFGNESLSGLRVAIQGLGHVGMALAGQLHAAGAQILAADVNAEATARAAATFGAAIVEPAAIHASEADVFAPCALGGILTAGSIQELRAPIVCDSANNQLADPGVADALFARGVLYCPDYVVNSGGLINVAREPLRIGDDQWVEQRLDTAITTFRGLVTRSMRERRPTLKVADDMVAAILSDARRQRALRSRSG